MFGLLERCPNFKSRLFACIPNFRGVNFCCSIIKPQNLTLLKYFIKYFIVTQCHVVMKNGIIEVLTAIG